MKFYFYLVLNVFLLLLFSSVTAEEKKNLDRVESSKPVNKKKFSESGKDLQAIDQSKKSEKPKVDIFDPPGFKEPGTVKKAMARVQTEINTKKDGIPEISLKAKIIKDDQNAMAVLLIDKEEMMVEPNEVFPIVIKDKTWELSIKSITRNGVAIEINYNSIKLLVK